MAGELKDLKKQEKQIKSTFDGVRKFVEQYRVEKHEAQVATRLEMLDAAMKRFYTVQRKLELAVEDEDDTKEDPEERLERQQKRDDASAVLTCFIEDTYCELKACLKAFLPLESERAPAPQPTALPTSLPGLVHE